MTAPSANAAKVIIVDDAAAVRTLLRTLLSSEGYRVVGDLASGGHLLAAVEQLQPDIVCLDYNLPDGNGIDLLKEIHAAHPTVAVVMITGSTDPELECGAAEAGTAGFIRKPFSPDKILKELQQVVLAQRLLVAAKKAGQPPAAKPRARAVIADDSATMRQLLRAILERAAVEVVAEAWDGRQAADLVAAHRPDLVCLDIDMPVMSGLEALQAIHAGQPQVRTLMVTGSANREAIVQAGKAGARGYILKPFHPDKVIEAVDKLLAR